VPQVNLEKLKRKKPQGCNHLFRLSYQFKQVFFYEFNNYWKNITTLYNHSNNTIEIVNHLYNTNSEIYDISDNLLLEDINVIKIAINNLQQTSTNKIRYTYQTIYNLNSNLLNYKCKLQDTFFVIETNYKYQNKCLIEYLKTKNNFNNIPNVKTEHFITLWNNDVFLSPITGWNILLKFYIDRELTGWELIDVIKKYGLININDYKDLEDLVVGFIASKLLFFNELQIVNN